MHRRRTGRAPNRPESAQANASPIRTRERQARRVRRGGGGGAAAARRPPPGLRHAAPRTGAAVHAQTAVFGVRRRTRGMVCASHCAHSVAVVGRQRVGRERTTSPHTVRGARRMLRSQPRGSRRTASLALRALRRQSGVTVAQAQQLIQAKAEVRPRRHCPVAPVHAGDTSVVAEVVIARTRALGEFRSDSIPARLPPALTARRNVHFFRFFAGPRCTCEYSEYPCEYSEYPCE